MKKLYLFMALLILTTAAFADWDDDDRDAATVTTSAVLDQVQGQDQMQTQANQQSVAFNSPDDITVRNTASGNAPNVYSSAPCMYGGSGGVGLPGFNISGAKMKKDEECDLRETARLLGGLGENELAVMLLCTSPIALAALGDKCKPSTNLQQQVMVLQRQNQTLLEERSFDKAECDDMKARGDVRYAALSERCTK